MSKIEEKVENLVKTTIKKLGYELYDVLYLKEGQNTILRIVIDSEKGISLDDCEKVNDEIKDIIDEADLIKEQYFLEISSPGIERLLRKDWQLKKAIGEEVDIKLFKKDENGVKRYIGVLSNVTEEFLYIETDKKVKGILVTTTSLSKEAKDIANYLHIQFRENEIFDKSYPCIKCNINRISNEKIYHLPFDQQYDHIQIEIQKGERYLSTVQEAENLGYRRAKTYYASKK